MDGGESSCSCVDASQNAYGTFVGNATDWLGDVYTINIRYTTQGATKQLTSLACGFVTPVPVQAGPGLLAWTDVLTYGKDSCQDNGDTSLVAQQQDGSNPPRVWNYGWSSDGCIDSGVVEFTPDNCDCPSGEGEAAAVTSEETTDDFPMGATVGAAVGGVMVLLLLGGLLLRRNQRRRTPSAPATGTVRDVAVNHQPVSCVVGTPDAVALPYDTNSPPPRHNEVVTQHNNKNDPLQNGLPDFKDQVRGHIVDNNT